MKSGLKDSEADKVAHFRKRDNGFYYAYWKEKRSNGLWYTMAKALKTKNKFVAQKRFNNLFAEDLGEVKECYVEDWVELLKRSLGTEDLDSKTTTKYIFHAERFIGFFNGRVRKMSDFRHEHIIEFINNLNQSNYSKSTVAGYGRSLRKMFNIALDLEYVRKSPMKRFKVGKMEQRQRFFNPSEIIKILEVAKEDQFQYALVLYSLQTGFRIEEVVDSFWENINHTNRTITVIGKGKKSRRQKIPALAYEAIMKLNGKWPTLFGKQQKQLYRDVKVVLAKADVKGSPHVFRDSYATYSIKIMPLSTLRERMGHSSLLQTDKYTHALNSEVDPEVMKYFEDWQIQR
ncbi:MAG: tyrosine-type recombinase/integrase [Candidatus Omnitrophica bacterium]|nr:tyrosine-type recombinase/integrase [Candidatus Omnitrophota bacterium]